MEKESVKKFDLEAAFKALDEIDIPQVKGIKANRVNLKERFAQRSATETLVEDYYDVSNNEDLEEAQEEREGEVAQAKLARIEKIVDLDAESPDDLLPSYVGKVIMQCPQCMTLFYKNPEDIEHSEENPDVVNINEVCQHCGNTSGYTLIGKVGAVSEDEANEYQAEETPAEEENELDLDFEEEPTEEAPAEENNEEDLDLDLNLEEVPEEETNESLNLSKEAPSDFETEYKSENLTLNEETETESLNKSEEAPSENETENASENNTLNEEVDKDLDKKLKEHNDYIAYLQQMIKQEEEALKKAENEEIKAAIQRRLDAFNADLEAALPDAVKSVPEVAADELADSEPVEDLITAEPKEEEEPVEDLITTEPKEENLEEKCEGKNCKVVRGDDSSKVEFEGTLEECNKVIEKNANNPKVQEHGGLKIADESLNSSEAAPSENETENKSDNLTLNEDINPFEPKKNPFKPEEPNPFEPKKPKKPLPGEVPERKYDAPKDPIICSNEGLEEAVDDSTIDAIIASWGNIEENLTEEGNLDALLDSDEFKKPISDKEVDAIIADEKSKEESLTEAGPGDDIEAIMADWADTSDTPATPLTPEEQKEINDKKQQAADAKQKIADGNATIEDVMQTWDESLEEDADVNYIEYMHSYCNALEPHMDELRKIDNVEDLKKAILDIVNKDPDVNVTEKKNYFTWVVQNKKWSSPTNLMKYLEKAMAKAKSIEVKVDDEGELVKNVEEGYTGNPAERTTHLEYTDDNLADGKAVLPDNIEKQLTEGEECKDSKCEDDLQPAIDARKGPAYVEKPLEECGEKPLKEEAEVPAEEEVPVEEEPVEGEPEAEEEVPVEEAQPIETTVEEVKEIATEVANKVAEPVADEEAAEEQQEEIKEIVDETVEEKLGEEKPAEDEAEEAPVEEPEFNEDDIDELDECSLNKHIDEYLQEVYSNVKCFEATECKLHEGKLIVEGKISFNSGKEKLTMFEFLPNYCEGKLFFEGYNKDFSEDRAFTLNCSINESKTLITESFGYKYVIGENLVEGLK